METMEALADPTRRRIVEMLAEHDRSAGEIGAAFTISQPAVSKHLRVLREAGLVRSRGEAQRRIYRLDPEPLEDVEAWLRNCRRFWTQRLDRLEQHLKETRGRKTKGGTR